MKRLCLASAFFLSLSCSSALAQEPPSLGNAHFYLGLSGMNMQHATLEPEETGLHLGVAGYKHLGRNWYLGAEIGAGSNLALFGAQSGITTVAMNGKRVFADGTTLRFDLGAGLSYNNVTYDENNLFSSEDDAELEDWVLGAQVLANVHAKLGEFILGANVTYMLTADVEGLQGAEGLEEGWDYSNITVGIHLGFLLH